MLKGESLEAEGPHYTADRRASNIVSYNKIGVGQLDVAIPLITKEPTCEDAWSSDLLTGLILSSVNASNIEDFEMPNRCVAATRLGTAGEMEAIGGMLDVCEGN